MLLYTVNTRLRHDFFVLYQLLNCWHWLSLFSSNPIQAPIHHTGCAYKRCVYLRDSSTVMVYDHSGSCVGTCMLQMGLDFVSWLNSWFWETQHSGVSVWISLPSVYYIAHDEIDTAGGMPPYWQQQHIILFHIPQQQSQKTGGMAPALHSSTPWSGLLARNKGQGLVAASYSYYIIKFEFNLNFTKSE